MGRQHTGLTNWIRRGNPHAMPLRWQQHKNQLQIQDTTRCGRCQRAAPTYSILSLPIYSGLQMDACRTGPSFVWRRSVTDKCMKFLSYILDKFGSFASRENSQQSDGREQPNRGGIEIVGLEDPHLGTDKLVLNEMPWEHLQGLPTRLVYGEQARPTPCRAPPQSRSLAV